MTSLQALLEEYAEYIDLEELGFPEEWGKDYSNDKTVFLDMYRTRTSASTLKYWAFFYRGTLN